MGKKDGRGYVRGKGKMEGDTSGRGFGLEGIWPYTTKVRHNFMMYVRKLEILYRLSQAAIEHDIITNISP